MKTALSIAGVVAGLTLAITPTVAHADIKNVGGLVCKHYGDSEAPKSAELITFGGKLCNNSATDRLRVTCPLTQDLGDDESVTVEFDYVNYNENGINGQQHTHPEEEFLCSVFSRTRYANAFYWGGWQSAADVNGYGATPTVLQATANEMRDNYFIHGVCFIPQTYGGARSCVSHLKYNEH